MAWADEPISRKAVGFPRFHPQNPSVWPSPGQDNDNPISFSSKWLLVEWMPARQDSRTDASGTGKSRLSIACPYKAGCLSRILRRVLQKVVSEID